MDEVRKCHSQAPRSEGSPHRSLGDAAWDREILTTPGATIFHNPPGRVFSWPQTYGHTPLYHRIGKPGQPAVSCFPSWKVSAPSADAARGSASHLPISVLLSISALTARSCSTFFNHHLPAGENGSTSRRLRGDADLPGEEPSVSFYGHELELSQKPRPPFRVLPRLRPTGNTQGGRGGVTVVICNDGELHGGLLLATSEPAGKNMECRLSHGHFFRDPARNHRQKISVSSRRPVTSGFSSPPRWCIFTPHRTRRSVSSGASDYAASWNPSGK